jgi:hypothetical protein
MASGMPDIRTTLLRGAGLRALNHLRTSVSSDRRAQDHDCRLDRSDTIHILKSGRERSNQLSGRLGRRWTSSSKAAGPVNGIRSFADVILQESYPDRFVFLRLAAALSASSVYLRWPRQDRQVTTMGRDLRLRCGPRDCYRWGRSKQTTDVTGEKDGELTRPSARR